MQKFLNKFGQESRVDVLASNKSPDRSFPEIDYGGRVYDDHSIYFDREIMEREWEQLWTRQWTIAGRLSDLAEIGDYFLYQLGPESFIVVRTDKDTIKAYYNVCHHRGARLLSEPFGKVSSFCCPFHSWTWSIDGSLKRITDRETFRDGALCGDLNLTEVACDTWQGFVFINMNPSPEPLLDQLGDLPEIMSAYGMERMALVNDIETLWPVNWKTVLDAFMEGYHAHRRHPELLRYIDDYHFQHDLFANGSSRMIIPVGVKSPRYGDRDVLTAEMRELAEPFGLDCAPYENNASQFRNALAEAKQQWAERVGLDFSEFTRSQLADDWNLNCFPNVTFNAHPEGILVMRYRPHPTDPEQCYYDVWVLAHQLDVDNYRLPSYMPVRDPAFLKPESPRPERVFARLGDTSFGLVLDQDAETVPGVQQGLKSRAFKGLRLSEQEIRLKHFYHHYHTLMEADHG